MIRLLFLLLLAAPLALRAQSTPSPPFELVRSQQFQLQYEVPAGWNHLRQATDSSLALTYFSPANDLLVYIGKLSGAQARLTPAQALYQLTEQLGVPVNKQYATAYNNIRFLETTGAGYRDGQMIRYDALAAGHRGHMLLVYVVGTPDAFVTHEPVVQRMLQSLAPYTPRRAASR
ncbi:hypothetical protein GCM10027048_02140 [Hymenobacter coalescens]